MRIEKIFEKYQTTFSFEFFPPRSAEGSETLFQNLKLLEPLEPSFVSVTYGAGGTTRQLTHDLVARLLSETKLNVIPHLTCVGHTESEITEILSRYAQMGVGTVLALAGDPPKGEEHFDRSQERFPFALSLVEHIRTHFSQFAIGVAGFPEGHPRSLNRLKEMDDLKAKVDAGASYICTQLFFENHHFYDFRERCELAGIQIPIVAGIMPIVSLSGMKRMAELSPRTNFPAALLRALERGGSDPKAVERVGIHWATEQCRDLLDHKVAGLHFYTLNQSRATRQIYENLGISSTRNLLKVKA